MCTVFIENRVAKHVSEDPGPQVPFSFLSLENNPYEPGGGDRAAPAVAAPAAAALHCHHLVLLTGLRLPQRTNIFLSILCFFLELNLFNFLG